MLKKAATLLVLGLVGYGVFRAVTGGSTDLGVSEDPGLIDERVWLETLPESPKEYVHVSLFLDSEGLGIFHRGSAYDYRGEMFEFKRDKGNVKVTFPQSGRRADFSYTVKTCSEKKPFDLCLDLSANPWGGPKRYYGFSDADAEQKAVRGLPEVTAARTALAKPKS